MSQDELRARLRGEEKGFLSKFSDRISYVERLRPWFGGTAAAGALLAGITRPIESALGVGLTIFGAALAFGGGIMVVILDYKKLEISREAKDAHAIADDAINAAEAIESEMSHTQREAKQRLEALRHESITLDRQRRARIDVMRLMIETVEAALMNGNDASHTAKLMLKNASARLGPASGILEEDYFTVSIFRREKRKGVGKERMYRIGCFSSDPAEEQYDEISWPSGRGYTGTLWHDATKNKDACVALADTTLPDVRKRYPVDDPDPEREGRYLSVGAYPIRIERSDNIWGIVTATANRKGVFDRVGDKPTQGVEMTQDVAYVAALLAGLDRPAGGRA